jgi:hypothetical protein
MALTIRASTLGAATYTATFACTSCAALPTASNVTFPSPMIVESWDTADANVTNEVDLLAGDNPGDTYTWENDLLPDPTPELADYDLTITDTTTGDSEVVSGTVGIGDPMFQGGTDTGTLTFSPTPEPSMTACMLAGVGALLLTKKRSRCREPMGPL